MNNNKLSLFITITLNAYSSQKLIIYFTPQITHKREESDKLERTLISFFDKTYEDVNSQITTLWVKLLPLLVSTI